MCLQVAFFGDSSHASVFMLGSSYWLVDIVWYLLFYNMMPSLPDSQPREVGGTCLSPLIVLWFQPKLV